MSLNPVAQFSAWNYSNSTKENYTTPDANGNQVFIGTCIAVQEVQARDYSTTPGKLGKPRTWDNGDPVLNIRMAFADPNGDIVTFTFPEAGREQKLGKKPSVHMTMYGISGNNMLNLIGKTLQITTWPVNPATQQAWQRGNPRLFDVQELTNVGPFTANSPIPEELTIDVLLCNDGASGGQPVQQPVQPVQPVVVQPQAMQQQPVYQPTVTATQVQPQVPSGMDPQVAAQMQAMGATNVQPVVEATTEAYDNQNIPF